MLYFLCNKNSIQKIRIGKSIFVDKLDAHLAILTEIKKQQKNNRNC